jgi:hypothetical protein
MLQLFQHVMCERAVSDVTAVTSQGASLVRGGGGGEGWGRRGVFSTASHSPHARGPSSTFNRVRGLQRVLSCWQAGRQGVALASASFTFIILTCIVAWELLRV